KFLEPSGVKQGSYLELIKDTVLENKKLFSLEMVIGTDLDASQLKVALDKRSIRADLESGSTDEALKEKISAILDFEYPHKELEGLYIKTTVSNLKMAAMEEVQGETEELFKERERKEYIPLFAGGVRHISGTDRGSAYHALLALIDYTKVPSEEEWKTQFEKALENGITTKEELSLVNKDKLFMFAKTDMALRMHKAALKGKLFKEQPFVMGVSAKRLKENFPGDENVLIQGVIDVFFEEEDGIVVLDYKTDNVESESELIDRYRAQLDYYGEALTKLKGKPITQKVLYSFGLNKNIVIE
ncbi:MAG: PD-(D/E)XK nuclease family protein, partial [Lachnospiraceae bacterium]|nr:PD-(D/E)XK nuclease family protein [Lachnospiraceae bacterium]